MNENESENEKQTVVKMIQLPIGNVQEDMKMCWKSQRVPLVAFSFQGEVQMMDDKEESQEPLNTTAKMEEMKEIPWFLDSV